MTEYVMRGALAGAFGLFCALLVFDIGLRMGGDPFTWAMISFGIMFLVVVYFRP